MARLTPLLLLSAALGLSACETVGNTVAGLGDKIQNIEMPKFGAGARKDATPDAVAAEAALVAAKAVDCPRVGVVDDLNSLTQLVNGKEISSARLAGIRSQCAINDSNVIVDMDIDLEGTADPAAQAAATDQPSFSYPYFIAITTPSGDITAKEIFSATMTYTPGESAKRHTEPMRQVIPMTGEYNPRDYEILIGFQLTPEELAYNRSRTAEGKGAAPTQIESRKGSAAPAPIPEPAATPVHAAPVPHEQEAAIATPMPRGPDDTPAPMAAPAPTPAPAADADMTGTFIPGPAPVKTAAPESNAAYAPLPEPVIEATPNADPLPMPEEESGKPLYPVTTGKAPPPPQKIVPRVDSDVSYR